MLVLHIILAALALLMALCLVLRHSRKCFADYVSEILSECKSLPKEALQATMKHEFFSDFFAIPAAILGFTVLVLILIIICPSAALFSQYGNKSTREKNRNKDFIDSIPKYEPTSDPRIFEVEEECIDAQLDTSEVYYYESEYDAVLNGIIAGNKPEIDRIFAFYGKRLIYLPEWNNELKDASFADKVRYSHPGIQVPESVGIEEITYKKLGEMLHFPEDITSPSLVRYKGTKDGNLVFSIVPIESSDYKSLRAELKFYLTHCRGILSNLYSLDYDEPHYMKVQTADDQFDEDVKTIGREIRERVEQLKARGLSALAIKSLVGDIEDNPSRLVIDRHNRLFLPDFGNREIKLSPIHKAVFFLFLNHPEGIYLKDLGSYKEELNEIYGSISGRGDNEAIEDSLNKLTDPYDNSINEKCARIKNAFVSEFREDIARWYFIDGKKGEKKAIRLPREMVEWEIKG